MIVHKREDIILYLNEHGLVGLGAEIGVLKGKFSKAILSSWKGERLFSIDPWRHFEEGYIDKNNSPDDLQEVLYKMTLDNLSSFGERSRVLRLTSSEASLLFEDNQLDFVYIDANHSYSSVREDIGLWFPKVKSGGVVSGHDYFDCPHSAAGEFGVKQAVDEFFQGYDIIVTNDKWPSWMVVKS